MLASDKEATSEWVVYEGLLETVTCEWDVKDKESAMRKSGKSILNTENSWCKGLQWGQSWKKRDKSRVAGT